MISEQERLEVEFERFKSLKTGTRLEAEVDEKVAYLREQIADREKEIERLLAE